MNRESHFPRGKTWVLYLLAGSAIVSGISAQVTDLDHLGQTPGGSAFNITYDSTSQRLFVGCGTSIWVYDMADVTHPVRTAMRPFAGMINKMILDGDVLFAATTHDGLWALNATSPTLEPLAHFLTPGDSGACDLKLYGDTLYLANGFRVIALTFNSIFGFTEQTRFGQPNAMAAARRGSAIAVGSWGFLNGTVSVYDAGNLNAPRASWTSGQIQNLQDLQFADRRDDIIYVCGGTPSFGFTGVFYALRLVSDSLYPVDSFKIGGFPGLANAQILNMDSRHDTLFLATTAGLNGLVTDVPVIDATGLPNDTMQVIGHIRPGLWHFDVAIIDRPAHRYMAIASEWYGVWINDITSLQPIDTVATFTTGGWCHRSYLRNDTLWACMNGYGLVAYDVDSLLFPVRFMPQFELLRIFEGFPVDFTFVDDTLICIADGLGTGKYGLYSLAPWHQGGQPGRVANFGSSIVSPGQCLATIRTDRGIRVAGGTWGNLPSVPGTIELYDPYEYPRPQVISATTIGGQPAEFIASGDTLFTGALDSTVPVIAAYHITQDTALLLASAPAPGTVTYIAKQGDLLAAACGNNGVAWYRIQGDSISELGRTASGKWVADVELADSRLYVAEQFKGLEVYDLSNPDTAILVATSRGSGGWEGMFGSTSVRVGPDRKIYLSDFNSGVFIIEPAPAAVAEDSRVTAHGIALNCPALLRAGSEIRYSLSVAGEVELKIYNSAGRHVRSLACGWQPAGQHSVAWDARDERGARPGSGVYFLTLTTGSARATKKLTLLPYH